MSVENFDLIIIGAGTRSILNLIIGGMMILTSAISICPMALAGICPGNLVKKIVGKKGA